MSDTAKLLDLYTFAREGVAMNAEKKDVATLIELLKMEAERWP